MKKFYLFIVILAVAGCSTLHISPVDKEKLLNKRVEAYIEALDHNDLVQVYNFLHPDCKRHLDRIQFIQRTNIRYRSVELESIKFLDEDKSNAKVTLKAKLSALGFTFKDFLVKNKWSYYNGDWFVWMDLSLNNRM